MKWLLCIFAICSMRGEAEEARYMETLYPEWGQSFQVTNVLHREKSDFWDLILFENPQFGRVLAIDGVIQLTEADEAVYSEMMAHVPILTHGNATSVLIIGGGDGCILREVLKHDTVEKVVLVEIDNAVIEIAKKFFPDIIDGAFEDPRVEVIVQDAAEYVKMANQTFDVIICDSTDPVGPAKVLFAREFFANCKSLLEERGIMVNQNGVPFIQKEELKMSQKNREGLFEIVSFYVAPVPTYTGGFMTLGWSTDVDYCLCENMIKERLSRVHGKMKYYNSRIHTASFALPEYISNEE